MRTTYLRASAAVIALAVGATGRVVAQSPTPQAPTPAPVVQERTASQPQTTFTGCVQRESDYRRAQDAGRGGVAGTGVGAGNEFVLMSATGMAYELTGSNESQAEKYIGRRVEVSGKVKPAEVATSGRPTGGPTAGRPPEGVDVGGKDLQLVELEVMSVREVPGTCPAS